MITEQFKQSVIKVLRSAISDVDTCIHQDENMLLLELISNLSFKIRQLSFYRYVDNVNMDNKCVEKIDELKHEGDEIGK